MYLLSYLVPETHLDITKQAIFEAGGGCSGPYSHCAWQTLGEGQFMPLRGSQAFIGEVDSLEKAKEYKVEIVCKEDLIKAIVTALKAAHPYETPAYQVITLENF